MSPLLIGVEVAAHIAVALMLFAVIGTIVSFIQAQTSLLQVAFTTYKNPTSHYHPFTQSLLDGSSPDLKLAQRAIKRGDKTEAKSLIEDICQLLEAEDNKSIRKQLQTKLRGAIK
jgi:hypothetical protein